MGRPSPSPPRNESNGHGSMIGVSDPYLKMHWPPHFPPHMGMPPPPHMMMHPPFMGMIGHPVPPPMMNPMAAMGQPMLAPPIHMGDGLPADKKARKKASKEEKVKKSKSKDRKQKSKDK